MKLLLAAICFVTVIFSCKRNKNDYLKAENAFDAGREFIDGCLKGDFEKAGFYMLKDAENDKRLKKMEVDYRQKSSEDQTQYHDASINILEDDQIDEHTHIINYKNSYDKIARKVKVVQQNGNWLVDFKYTFDGNL